MTKKSLRAKKLLSKERLVALLFKKKTKQTEVAPPSKVGGEEPTVGNPRTVTREGKSGPREEVGEEWVPQRR